MTKLALLVEVEAQIVRLDLANGVSQLSSDILTSLLMSVLKT